MPTLWRDVAFEAKNNLFIQNFSPSNTNISMQTDRFQYSLDEECRMRLQTVLKLYTTSQRHDPQSLSRNYSSTDSGGFDRCTTCNSLPAASFSGYHTPRCDSAKIFDTGFDLYIRKFHPLMPFIHASTLIPKNAPTPMLFIMCLIGLTALNTEGSMKFVTQAFPVSSKSSLCLYTPSRRPDHEGL